MELQVGDFKDRNNQWVKSFRDKTRKVLVNTKASLLWDNLLKRSAGFNKPKTYVDASHNFKDFQDFAEWCQNQVGYYNEGWQLDKDIVQKGNKIYSKECCVFVPRDINNFFIKSDAIRGTLPIGVFEKEYGKYGAQCSNTVGIRRYIGSFSTPEEAFCAYKKVKESVAKILATKWKGRVDSRVYEALINFEVQITD